MGSGGRGGGFHHLAEAAQIVLQIINSPVGVGLRVLFFVIVAAFKSGASFWSGRRINSQLQSFAVNVIGERFHVGKFFVGLDDALRVAFAFPGVIYIDVNVSGVAHAGGDHRVGLRADSGVVNFATK